jgi:rhodanese-related sulfurtransferase
MRKAALIALAVTLIATLASGQYKRQPHQPAPGSTPLTVSGSRTNASQFPRISQEDAYKLYKSDKAVFIDVRSNTQFKLDHIEGALSIPGSQLVRRFAEVPHGKTVITYCACSEEQSSGRAATDLITHGVKNVFALKGGIQEWKKLGQPTKDGPK